MEERGQDLPDWFKDKPELALGDEFYLSAFSELNTCRQSGWDRGPIPWTAIVAFMDQYELEYDLRVTFLRVIRALDSVLLKRKGNISGDI